MAYFNSTLTGEQRIQKGKVSLMNDDNWRWMSSIMVLGTIEFVRGDHRVKTAATDGLNEIYNLDFIETLTNEQVKYVILHENFHKLFRHLFVWSALWKQDAKLANIACDVVINNQQLAGQRGIAPIDGGVDMPQYADESKWNAKAIFDDLKKQGQGGGGQGKPQKGQGQGAQDDAQAGHDQHLWEEAETMTPEEAKDAERQIDAALRQAKLAGGLGGGMPRGVKQMLVPQVDWRAFLSEFVKAQCSGKDKVTWRKPHRTYLAYDLYLPDNYSEQVERILIGGDTSGSIGSAALSQFLGYMQQLCDEVTPNGVDIAWWDTQVRHVDRFERDTTYSLANAVCPAGGGGTTPSCVADWLKQQPANKYVCAVMVTDGEFYGDGVGDWDIPVLWLVVNNRTVPNIPVGVTVQVGELR